MLHSDCLTSHPHPITSRLQGLQHLSHEAPSLRHAVLIAKQLYSVPLYHRGNHPSIGPREPSKSLPSSPPQPRLEAGATDGAVQPEHVKDLVGALGHEELLLVLA